MKTQKMICLGLICLLTFQGFTQTQWTWTWKSPTPTGNSIIEIWNFSDMEFLAVGSGGLIMKTNDAGANWTLIQSGTSKWLGDIYFIDANNGWICGEDGIILHTLNHGSTWQAMETGASDLSGISFPSVNIGYACGADGTIIKTTDGGVNWESKNSGTTSYLTDMFFTSETEGFVAGDYAILKTINGGNIWAEKYYNADYHFNCIKPVGSSVFAFGYNFMSPGPVSLKSTDGGSTWSLSNSGMSGNIYAVSVLDANTIWVSCSEGRVFKTTDAGSNWTNKNPNGNINGDFYAACFPSSTSGVVCGNNGVIFTTANDGANWTARSNKLIEGNTNCLTFSDALHGCWLVNSDEGTLFRTTDGGNTWTSQESGFGLNYVQMFSDGKGIRYIEKWGTPNRFETTSDHGATWTANGGNKPENLWANFGFIDINTGFCFTNGNISHKTTNGGVTWTQTTRPYIDSPGRYSIPDVNSIWVIDNSGGNMLRSIDGGATWTETVSTGGYGGAIYASDANNAWVGKSNGKIYKTTNGGVSFTEYDPLVSGKEIRDVYFLSPDTGFILAANGYYSMTFNSGTTWTSGIMGSSNWNRIGIANHSNIFFGGDNGMLIQWHKVTAPSAIEDFGFDNSGFVLKQNYPNPFNSKTTIEFELTSKAMVSLIIYDFLGREVKTLFTGDLPNGHHSVEWDARNVSEGIYFYCLKSGTSVVLRKLIILKGNKP